jgi:FlaA1/EpsC-like NDP-sugar epimerase
MLREIYTLLKTRPVRRAVIKLIDASVAAAALYIAVSLRMGGDIPPHMLEGLSSAVPITTLVTMVTFYGFGVYRRAWRYVSISDLMLIVPAATTAIVASLIVLWMGNLTKWMPGSVPVIHWIVLLALLSAVRLGRRVVREHRSEVRELHDAVPAGVQRILLAGAVDRIEVVLRDLQRTHRGRYQVVGILDSSDGNRRLRLRGVPVLGSVDAVDHVVKRLDLAGQRPASIFIVDGSDPLSGPAMVRLVNSAESLGMSVGRVADTVDLTSNRSGELDLRFIEMAELLSRPQLKRDLGVARSAIEGQRVLVTGAGGTIGSELVRQIAALDPAEIVLLDHCEFNLYTVDMEMRESFPALRCHPVLCSIRQRECLMQVFATHRPELVFHAAALKHVPLVEANPCSGVLTNVLGTRNVADAVRKFGVRAMVQVSTDKAVNPVGIMGATKRLGELYCQALDLAGAGQPGATRFMTVRFGNVLGSSGSLIPLLQRQLSRRVPLTITHPDIKRYFMTVHEAVQLILQSSAQAVAANARRGRIFVLDMGEPIKIIDIARRMIRLAGLEPDVDVKIQIVGLRPGEKLYEEIFDSRERRLESVLPGIFEAEPDARPLPQLDRLFDSLEAASLRDDVPRVRALIHAALADEPVPAEVEALPFGKPRHMPVPVAARGHAVSRA